MVLFNMFSLFRKKEKVKEVVNVHTCDFSQSLGFYYKMYRTEFKNQFDTVYVYVRKKCECGNHVDAIVSKEDFIPSLHHAFNDEREDYVKKLESKGVLSEVEFNIETNKFSNRKRYYG